MKKVIALFLLLAAVLPLSSCKSKAEKDYEREKAALKVYEDAAKEARERERQFDEDMSEYQSLLNNLDNYKK